MGVRTLYASMTFDLPSLLMYICMSFGSSSICVKISSFDCFWNCLWSLQAPFLLQFSGENLQNKPCDNVVVVRTDLGRWTIQNKDLGTIEVISWRARLISRAWWISTSILLGQSIRQQTRSPLKPIHFYFLQEVAQILMNQNILTHNLYIAQLVKTWSTRPLSSALLTQQFWRALSLGKPH